MIAPPRRAAGVLLVLVLMLVGAPAYGASHDPRTARERVRRQQAAATAELNVLRAEDAKVEAALAAIESNVRAQQARLADAERAAREAEVRQADARAAEAAVARRVDDLRTELRRAAVDAYINGQGDLVDLPGEPSRDLAAELRKRTLADVVVATADDTQDRLRASQEDLTLARAAAEQATVEARDRREAASSRLSTVTAARNQQVAFAAKVDQRIESRLAEAASLARLDQQLSATIQRQQEALARRNTARPGVVGRSAPVSSNVPLRNVRGIYVHESMADQLESLLAAADADGVPLSGAGYRDSADQRRLRQANCPDPERSPASSCRPPTARPGQSMHERGLAVDFTYQGRIISSRSSPGFRWLNANARRFGLYNLPSEPWHWSTNGD